MKLKLLFLTAFLLAIGIGFAAPSVSIISPSASEAQFISATSSTFNVSSNETINVTNSLIIWTNQSGAVTNFSAINVNNVTNATWRTFSDLLDGTHSFRGYIISNLSDTSGAVYTAVRNITQDDTNPVALVGAPSGNVQVGADPANISLTFTLTETNLDRCTYNTTEVTPTQITSCANTTLILASSSSGITYTISLTVNDSAGNSITNNSVFTLEAPTSGGGGSTPTASTVQTTTPVATDTISPLQTPQSQSTQETPTGMRIPILSDFIDSIVRGFNKLFGFGNTQSTASNIQPTDEPKPLFKLPRLN